MIEYILSPQIFLTLAFICALACFFSSNSLVSTSFLLIQSLLVNLYYLSSQKLGDETLIINLFITLLSFLIFSIIFYFHKASLRPWQKTSKLFMPISLLIFFIIYQKSNNIALFSSNIEIKKDNLDTNESLIIYSFFSILLIIICSIILFNNKVTKRKT